MGGTFLGNEADQNGGVWFLSSGGVLTSHGGLFSGNWANSGSVGCAEDGSEAYVIGGAFKDNSGDYGGVFAVHEDTEFAVSPGGMALDALAPRLSPVGYPEFRG